MKYNIFIIIFLSQLLFCLRSNAQIGEGGTPPSFANNSFISQNGIYNIQMPQQNNHSLQVADSLFHLDSSYAFTFATPIKMNIEVQNYMTWDTLQDGSLVGRIRLTSNTAYSCFLIFDEFFLPKNTKLFAYNGNGTQILGAFTNNNNNPSGRFSLGPIIGDNIILEYIKPPTLDSVAHLKLAAFVHAYKDIFNHVVNGNGDPTFGLSASCNINVKCPEGSSWCNQRRSVALIVALDANNHYIAICTGSLITNEKRDLRPYFLTAHHCQIGSNVNDWIFIFNYQSDDCNNPSNAPSTTFSIAGATLRANRCQSDFALLELSSRPPGNYNAFYAGWNNENSRPQNGASITHPRGDIKKIAFFDKKATRNSVNFNTCSNNVKCWNVKWENGTVQPGSSGGPLFNSSGLIVGQVYGGDVSKICTNNDKPYYGRFDLSWDEGSSSSSRLRDWLSPNSISNFYIQSMSGDEPCKSNIFIQNANDLHTSVNVNGLNNPGSAGSRTYNGVYMSSGTIETGQNVTIQSSTSVEFYGETIILGPGFTANAGSSFIASPQPCLRGCNTGVGKVGSFDVENEEAFITLGYDRSEQEENDEDEDSIVPNNQSLNPIIISGNILLFPNPTSGKFTLQTSSNFDEKYSVKIFDYTGKLIYSENNIINSTLNIDLSGNTKGVYLINIIQGNKIYIEKLIIR